MFVKRVSSDTLVIGAPAKVNLFLHVLGKRPDGYHDIESLFQAVSLFDRLTFTRLVGQPETLIEVSGAGDLPSDQTNLVTRSYDEMHRRFGLRDGLSVKLEKNIPIAAGLGGGSSDGAATIMACRLLFDLKLSAAEMATISLSIGSDLPFFFSHGSALVEGRGEVVADVELPTDYWLVLVTPNLAISTAESYARLRLPLTKSRHPFYLPRWTTLEELLSLLKGTSNDFEEVHLRSFPELGRIKDGLLDNGALLARLSGSGPTFYGLYGEAPEIEDGRVFDRDDWRVSLVRPVVLSSE